MTIHDSKAIQSKMLQLSMHCPTLQESDTAELNHQHHVANDRMEKGSLLGVTGHEWKEPRNKSRNNILLVDNLAFENHEEPEDSLTIKTSEQNTRNYIGDLNVVSNEHVSVTRRRKALRTLACQVKLKDWSPWF